MQAVHGTSRTWMHCYYCPRPERMKPVRFVRDQRWKLYGDGRFYDVQNDVLEQQPLGLVEKNSEAAIARKKLAAALKSIPSDGQTLLSFEAKGR